MPQLVKADILSPGVAADNAGEFLAALGFLELVRERSERGEPNAASLLAGTDSECDAEVGLAGAAVANQDDRVTVIDPGALSERGDRGLRDLRVVGEPEVLESFDLWKPRVDQPAFLA